MKHGGQEFPRTDEHLEYLESIKNGCQNLVNFENSPISDPMLAKKTFGNEVGLILDVAKGLDLSYEEVRIQAMKIIWIFLSYRYEGWRQPEDLVCLNHEPRTTKNDIDALFAKLGVMMDARESFLEIMRVIVEWGIRFDQLRMHPKVRQFFLAKKIN